MACLSPSTTVTERLMTMNCLNSSCVRMPTSLMRRAKGFCAAVDDWHFGAVDLDAQVVDAQAAQRSQQVFDGGDARLADSEGGRERRVDDVFGTNGNDGLVSQIGADEHQAVVDGRRNEPQRDGLAGVKPDALNRGCPLKCALLETVTGHDVCAPPLAAARCVFNTYAIKLAVRLAKTCGISRWSTLAPP